MSSDFLSAKLIENSLTVVLEIFVLVLESVAKSGDFSKTAALLFVILAVVRERISSLMIVFLAL